MEIPPSGSRTPGLLQILILPKPLDEGTSPELNEKERVIDQKDDELPSVDVEIGAVDVEVGAVDVEIGTAEVEVGTVEVEVKSQESEVKQLPHISSGDEKRSSSKSSEDHEDYKKRTSKDYEKEKERLKDLHSGKKKNMKKNKKKIIPKVSKEIFVWSSASNDSELWDNMTLTPSSSAASEASEGPKNALKEANAHSSSENDERNAENEETPSGNVDKRKVLREREREREHRRLISLIRPVITETKNRVLITMKAVSKKTVIRIFDNEAKITCENKFSRKSKCDLSDKGKWVRRKTFTRKYQDLVIIPKVPKTKASKKLFEDVDGSDDSDSDKENSFEGSSAGKVLEKNKEDVKLGNKCIPINEDKVTEFTLPSPSTKRPMSMALGKSKKIRLCTGSIDEEMKISSEEEKVQSEEESLMRDS